MKTHRSLRTESALVRKVLITGSARGIGAAIADRYRDAEWTVVEPRRLDLELSDPLSVSAFCQAYADESIDVLINNAGENRIGSIEALPENDLRVMFETNFMSVWSLIRCFAPKMRERGWGRIVNLASVYGIRSREGRGGYTGTKAALIGLTKTAAIEFGLGNVLVNAVAPGFVDTDLTRKNNTPEQIARLCLQVPLGRLASVAEIAEFVYWLGSDKNTYITGQTLAIDGGFLVR